MEFDFFNTGGPFGVSKVSSSMLSELDLNLIDVPVFSDLIPKFSWIDDARELLADEGRLNLPVKELIRLLILLEPVFKRLIDLILPPVVC
jgi:hypothetical protein